MKKIFVILIFIFIIFGGFSTYLILSSRFENRFTSTTIAVTEGVVDVYRLKEGGQKTDFKQLKSGESLIIESSSLQNKSFLMYTLLKKSIPDFVDRNKQKISTLTTNAFGTNKITEISAPKLQNLIEQSSAGQLKNVDLDLTAEGYELSGDLTKKQFQVNFFCSGYLYLSNDVSSLKKLKIRIYRMMINDIKMPAPVLRIAETLFNESFENDTSLPFAFKTLEHHEGVIKSEIFKR